MWPKRQETSHLVTLTEEIRIEKFNFGAVQGKHVHQIHFITCNFSHRDASSKNKRKRCQHKKCVSSNKKSHTQANHFLTFIFIALSILLNLFVTNPKRSRFPTIYIYVEIRSHHYYWFSPQLHRMIYHGLLSLVNQNHFLAFCTFYELTLINTVLVLSISTSKNIGTSNMSLRSNFIFGINPYIMHIFEYRTVSCNSVGDRYSKVSLY